MDNRCYPTPQTKQLPVLTDVSKPPLGPSCNLICITVVTPPLHKYRFPQFPRGLPQPRFASRTFKSNILSPYSKLVEWPLNSAFSLTSASMGHFFHLPQFRAHLYSKLPHFWGTNPHFWGTNVPHLRHLGHIFLFFSLPFST